MRKPRSPRRPGETPAGSPRVLRSPRATLFFFGAIGLLLWGRLLLKEVPQTASALDPPAAATAPEPAADAATPGGSTPDAPDAAAPRVDDPQGASDRHEPLRGKVGS